MPILSKFNVIWTKNASKGLEHFDILMQKRIIAKLDDFSEGKKVDIISIGNNEFRIRIGNLRIILVKLGKDYFIEMLGQRKNIYKNWGKK
jgi:hypothetical protein